MSFTLSDYTALRPYVYHLTARANLSGIKASRTLHSAAALADRAARPELIRSRRHTHEVLSAGEAPVVLRDQAPLHARNMTLDDGWSLDDFVEALRARVFFWPGSAGGPIAHGRRHYGRYASERPVIIRAECTALLASNSSNTPLACKYNSGSPRWSNGIASPRGAATFVSCEEATFRAGEAVEVTFEGAVHLPATAEYGDVPMGPWNRLQATRQRSNS